MAERLELPDDIGRSTYHALLFAVQDYMHDDEVRDLVHPVRDARRLSDVLSSYFLFDADNVRIVENPTRSEIFGALDDQAKSINEDDHLLIFFAGHGYWDELLNQGYWLPSDCREGNRSSWISNATIRDWVRGMRSKHTLLISDACFSGGIFRTRKAFSKNKALKRLYELPSRKAITSGTLTEVPDESVFLHYLTDRLRNNENPWISAEQLFNAIEEPVINNSPNSSMPQYGTIHDTGDEGGDFIFLRKGVLEEEARRNADKEEEAKKLVASRSEVPVYARPEIQKATLVIVSNCTGTLIIDGNEEKAIRANDPLKFSLQPGRHVIQINADGYTTWIKKIMVRAGESEVLEAELEKVRMEPALKESRVREEEVIPEQIFTARPLIDTASDAANPLINTWWKRAMLGIGLSMVLIGFVVIRDEWNGVEREFFGFVTFVLGGLPIILTTITLPAKRFGPTLIGAIVGGILFILLPFTDVISRWWVFMAGWGLFAGALVGRFVLSRLWKLRSEKDMHHV